MLLRALQVNPIPHRLAFFLAVRHCRRRAVREWQQFSVARLFTTEDEYRVLHLLYGGHISPYLPTSPPYLSISPQVLHLLYGGRVHYDALVLPSAL